MGFSLKVFLIWVLFLLNQIMMFGCNWWRYILLKGKSFPTFFESRNHLQNLKKGMKGGMPSIRKLKGGYWYPWHQKLWRSTYVYVLLMQYTLLCHFTCFKLRLIVSFMLCSLWLKKLGYSVLEDLILVDADDIVNQVFIAMKCYKSHCCELMSEDR